MPTRSSLVNLFFAFFLPLEILKIFRGSSIVWVTSFWVDRGVGSERPSAFGVHFIGFLFRNGDLHSRQTYLAACGLTCAACFAQRRLRIPTPHDAKRLSCFDFKADVIDRVSVPLVGESILQVSDSTKAIE
jgi:hypothetical protein